MIAVCAPDVVYLHDIRMSIAKHIFVVSVKSEFGNKGKVKFHCT